MSIDLHCDRCGASLDEIYDASGIGDFVQRTTVDLCASCYPSLLLIITEWWAKGDQE